MNTQNSWNSKDEYKEFILNKYKELEKSSNYEELSKLLKELCDLELWKEAKELYENRVNIGEIPYLDLSKPCFDWDEDKTPFMRLILIYKEKFNNYETNILQKNT